MSHGERLQISPELNQHRKHWQHHACQMLVLSCTGLRVVERDCHEICMVLCTCAAAESGLQATLGARSGFRVVSVCLFPRIRMPGGKIPDNPVLSGYDIGG